MFHAPGQRKIPEDIGENDEGTQSFRLEIEGAAGNMGWLEILKHNPAGCHLGSAFLHSLQRCSGLLFLDVLLAIGTYGQVLASFLELGLQF